MLKGSLIVWAKSWILSKKLTNLRTVGVKVWLKQEALVKYGDVVSFELYIHTCISGFGAW